MSYFSAPSQGPALASEATATSKTHSQARGQASCVFRLHATKCQLKGGREMSERQPVECRRSSSRPRSPAQTLCRGLSLTAAIWGSSPNRAANRRKAMVRGPSCFMRDTKVGSTDLNKSVWGSNRSSLVTRGITWTNKLYTSGLSAIFFYGKH